MRAMTVAERPTCAQVDGDAPTMPSTGRVKGFGWWLLGLTILAFLLGFYRIGHDSFWTDEATSIRYAHEAGWTRLWTVDHGNMFLYYGLLKVWLVVAKGEAAIRLFSLISFALIVPTVALLGRRLRGDVVGLLAAALVATNPLLVLYGQEARVVFIGCPARDGRRARRDGWIAGRTARCAHGRHCVARSECIRAPGSRAHGRNGRRVALHRKARCAPRAPGVGIRAVHRRRRSVADRAACGGSQQISWTGHSNGRLLSGLSVAYNAGGGSLATLAVAALAIVSLFVTLVALNDRSESVTRPGW